MKKKNITGFSIDMVASRAGNDPDVLRLENLDTDLPPPEPAIVATQLAVGRDEDNSYLPFTGKDSLRQTIAKQINEVTGASYAKENIIITNGATEGMLNAVLALLSPGDEVILTDPTYAGMIQRVRLANGVPRMVPFLLKNGEWRLDLETLEAKISARTKALFLMNPSMPTGAVLNFKEWEAIVALCKKHNLWLIYNAAMERILFENQQVIHPVTFPGMEQRTITIGSVSKEYRMIGWRIGWIVAPDSLVEDLTHAHLYNVVTPSGFSQVGAEAALHTPYEDFFFYLKIWEMRRNTVLSELKNFKVIPALGGWSMLMDVTPLGMDAEEASKKLLEKGKVAVTPMTHWGHMNSKQFIRLVFSNESVERLKTLGDRFRATFSNNGVFVI
ncbi:MAG: pyridoxal phosphate-dependent aminotransferase [Saprospiraceae bacterium]|nr:pyridoxal phosphate-dependent aminotransferase [Saprospiraceae bacterium]